MFKSFFFAIAFLVGVAFIVAFAVADTHNTERWEPRGNYMVCMSLESFVPRMKDYGGELLASGEISDAVISVMKFPDNSFGIFVYDPVSGYICNIATGWFAEPGMPV